MNTLIIYSSQTGFTKKYAEWLAQRLDSTVLTFKEAKKKTDSFFDTFDSIVYGGWLMAGNVVDSKWFLANSAKWRSKKLAIFCVGGSPAYSPDIPLVLDKLLSDEQRSYIKAFYCQGGINYEKMGLPSRLAMKAFSSMAAKGKNTSEKDRAMAEALRHSYDSTNEKFVEPIVDYLT